MEPKGTVFFHNDMTFKDGAKGEKLLVLLNTPSSGEPFLFVKTTSKQHDKPENAGCIPDHDVFFIPKGASFLSLPTWVQLFEIYEFDVSYVEKKSGMNVVGQLSLKIIDDLIECLFKSQEDDLMAYHKNLIRPKIDQSIHKLQELWNNR